jgi:multisubunit Na+/H+ antiporter MnhB subunit
MDTEIILSILLAFMIAGALVAVETKNLLSSVISLGAIGIGLSISFLFLQAPDLAIVQIAVEVVLLIYLIRATIGRDVIPERGHIGWPALAVVLLLSAGLLAFGIYALGDLGEFGRPVIARVPEAPSNRYLAEGVKETGAVNIVTSVILDYRAYDTLGEATVLFASILGAVTILRPMARSKREEGEP